MPLYLSVRRHVLNLTGADTIIISTGTNKGTDEAATGFRRNGDRDSVIAYASGIATKATIALHQMYFKPQLHEAE
nr:hypothetical protein [Tanacetum cinerariifolium]GEY39366.1 hypothetical protein [Tanacetum cinerariifolium]